MGGPNNFFKGKVAGKVPKKGDLEHRLKMATSILNEQIDGISDDLMNMEQKDFVKNFISLPARTKEIVIETMLEH